MVRITEDTRYNLMRAVERCSNYYKNTTHTYFFKKYTVIQTILLSFTSQEFLIKISGVW